MHPPQATGELRNPPQADDPWNLIRVTPAKEACCRAEALPFGVLLLGRKADEITESQRVRRPFAAEDHAGTLAEPLDALRGGGHSRGRSGRRSSGPSGSRPRRWRTDRVSELIKYGRWLMVPTNLHRQQTIRASRLLVGTTSSPRPQVMAQRCAASGAEIVTVALRRVDIDNRIRRWRTGRDRPRSGSASAQHSPGPARLRRPSAWRCGAA